MPIRDWLEFSVLRHNFRAMPKLLRMLTSFAISTLVLLIGSLIPNDFLEISGKPVSFAEWWSSGVGIVASLSGVLLPVSGYLLLRRHKHARIVYIGSVALILVFSLVIFGVDSDYEVPFFIIASIIVGSITSYLYLNKAAISYFRENL